VTALQTRPRVLTARDADGLRALVERDLVVNCVLDSRLALAPDLDSRRLGGFIWGIDDADAPVLRAAVFHGGNLIPVGQDAAGLIAIAEQLARGARGCSSIVGPAASVDAIWPVLAPHWGPSRARRHRQPLLVTGQRAAMSADPLVRPVAPSELARFLPAATAMFTEELGISPLAHGTAASYRARVAEVIASGRAFARFDQAGAVEFKAEIGALGSGTAQIQGVWVRPDLRGRGIGTAAMVSVIAYALQRAPSVSLYVNDFNEPARRMYARLGMQQQSTLSTVLF
jgi:predicted GNAT family acetyltransferase